MLCCVALTNDKPAKPGHTRGQRMRLRFRYVLVALAALLVGFLMGIPRGHAQFSTDRANAGISELEILHPEEFGTPLPVL